MKVLVTGGTGLVGKNLKELCPNFIYISTKDCNLMCYKETFNVFKSINPTHIIHLAAAVGGLYMNIDYNFDMLHKNIIINSNIMKICKELNIKNFIGCLSTCIFPDNIEYPITEEQLHKGEPHKSNEGYAYGKRILEVYCRQMNQIEGNNYVCIIPTNIYGKYDNFHLDKSHVIPGLIHKCYLSLMTDTPFIVKGSGKALRQFIYAKDLAKIIKYIIFNNVPYDKIICSPNKNDEVSIKKIVKIIAKYMGQTNVIYDTNYSDGQYRKTVSNDKLKHIIPNIKFTKIENGLKKTIDWFLIQYPNIRK
jgi:GDP-L-fucose synthase